MESTTSTSNICAACGKEGDSLKSCTACHMVKYCNRDCQISHRPQHKKACKKRAAELYDEKLFREVEPEECPICFQILPLDADEYSFKSCCGKMICNGCIYTMNNTEGADLCPFCRTPEANTDEENIKRLKKLMDKGNGDGFYALAGLYAQGIMSIPRDWNRAHELLLKAGELGCSKGYYNLAKSYAEGNGLERDMKKAQHYYEFAAMGGDVWARHNLGHMEGQVGNIQRAYKHYIIATRAGSEKSLEWVKQGFMQGIVSKDIYEECSHALSERQNEMQSDARDKAKASDMFNRPALNLPT